MDFAVLGSIALFVVVVYALIYELERREVLARERFREMEREAYDKYAIAVDGVTIKEFIAQDTASIEKFNKTHATEKEQAKWKVKTA